MERIAELIIKHLKSEISPAEEIELQEWIHANPENQEIFNRFNDPEQLRDLLNWTVESKSRILEDLRGELYPRSEAIVMRSRNYKRYLYVAAAVLFFAVIGVSGYWILNQKPGNSEVVQAKKEAYQNDVPAPLGNQATLVISGNKEINLDDAKNGLITDQGNVQVLKEGDELIYKVSSTETESEVLYHTLKTGRGLIKMQLPDSSFVWLNALTSITYPTKFIGDTRKVTVDGEAFFEVAKNKKKPFIVQAGDMSITVTGTSFAVSAYPEDGVIRTSLVEGSVKVASGNQEQRLSPGQQADVAKNGEEVIKLIKEGNIDEAIAFKDDMFDFRDTHIDDMMKQVKRWYGVEVEFQAKIDRHFNALVSRKQPLSRLLQLLEKTDRVHFRIEGNKVTVLP